MVCREILQRLRFSLMAVWLLKQRKGYLKQKTMANKFIKHKSQDNQHYFTLVASNGETIAVSEMYKTKAGMLKGIRSVRINAGKFEILAARVEKWAKQKDILTKATRVSQAYKTLEEATELLEAAHKADFPAYTDALGDVLVTIIIGAKMANVDLMDCLEDVLNIIEKRNGKIIDGQFVKDAE